MLVQNLEMRLEHTDAFSLNIRLSPAKNPRNVAERPGAWPKEADSLNDSHLTSSSELERLSQAEHMLAELARADEAAKLADIAEAARVYARKAELGTAAVNHATVIKARALKRMAELVDEGQERGEIARVGKPVNVTSQDIYAPATLTDLGIARQRLHEARKLEAISDAEITETGVRATEEGREVSLEEIKRTAHVSHNTGVSEWYTPAYYIAAVRQVLGWIDVDPASCAEANQVVQADLFYAADNDGLEHEWKGRVFLNPPYSQPLIARFSEKLIAEYRVGNTTEACVLVNNATETEWFQTLASEAAAICFPKGRVQFWHPERKAVPLQGQAVLYLGRQVDKFVDAFAGFGFVGRLH